MGVKVMPGMLAPQLWQISCVAVEESSGQYRSPAKLCPMNFQENTGLTLTFSAGPEQHTVPGRFVTLPAGAAAQSERGVEVEGVALEYVTDEVPHGLRAFDDDSKRKLDELRQRFEIMSQASVVPFEPGQ